jgi:zinc protease
MFKFGLVSLLIPIFLSCSSGSKNNSVSSSLDEFEIPVEKFVLSNGMTVLLSKNDKLPVYSIYSYYKVGSIYEEKGITGASHFLEHMMFKGAKNFGSGKFDTIIEGNGGASNAYTNYDSTVYYEHMPKDSLELILQVEADRMQNLLLEPEAFEKERQVVLEERKMRYENSPRGKLYLNTLAAFFEGTPYGRSVIGDVEDLKSVTRDQIQTYFKQFYTPNNLILVIAGDIDVSKTKAMIEKFYSPIPASKELIDHKKKMEHPERFSFKGKFNREIAFNGTSKNPMFMLSYQGEKIGTRKAYVLDLLSSILSGGKSSYLTQIYTQGKKPQVSYIYSANYNLTYAGVFYIMGEMLQGISLKNFKSSLMKDLNKSCNAEVVNTRSLQKVLNQYLVGVFDSLETNSGIASTIGDQEMYYGDYLNYKKMIDIYKSIGVNEVIQACREIFDPNKSIFTTVWEKN